jgi:hypothetical protein
VATPAAWRHLGLAAPAVTAFGDATLFTDVRDVEGAGEPPVEGAADEDVS